MSTKHVTGKIRVEVKSGTPMDMIFIKSGKDRTVAHRYATYGDKTRANFEEMARRWNAFEEPFGYYWETVHDESGTVVNSGFSKEFIATQPDPKVPGFTFVVTPVAAIRTGS